MSNERASEGSIVRGGIYGVLFVATILGFWAIFLVLRGDHERLNTTQHVPWGLWVASYVFFLGLSAGSFLLSSLVYVFGIKRFEAAGPLALFVAILCLAVGGVFILLDLGHPFRVYLVLTSMNISSVMAWMGMFYILYIVLVSVELYLAIRPRLVARATRPDPWAAMYRLLSLGSRDLSPERIEKDRKWLKILGIIGIPAAIAVHGGVGAIFAVAKARPNWFGGLFPIVFLISALASGGALLTFVMAVFSRRPFADKRDIVQALARVTIGILLFDALLLASEVLVTFYGEVVHDEIGWSLTLFGPYWWVFWFVQLLGGMVIPVILVGYSRTGRSIFWLGLASFLIVIGIFGTRLNIVIPPLIQPAFDALPQAYHHSRFAWGYFPSLVEWMVAIGVMALGTWGFLLGRKVLPLEEHANEEGRTSSV